MNKVAFCAISILIITIAACKKSDQRRCLKSIGEPDSLVYLIDNVYKFDLGNKIRYKLYQDSSNQIIVRGGKNMISFIEVVQTDSTVSVTNKNRCNFLRNKDEFIEVEIHSEDYTKIQCDPTDSLIFVDTIKTIYLDIRIDNGGGFMDLPLIVDKFRLDITGGVTHFKLGGEVSGVSEIFVKILAYGDARNLTSQYYLLTNKSTGDFYVNLESAIASVNIWGTGNVWYTGTPASLDIDKTGDGECLPL
ncbi:DUF2807 domain-containing protein [Crocinitomix catalasitica]|nr:DUF2807 domain-containing protein [Crocinitomix catalasitica]